MLLSIAFVIGAAALNWGVGRVAGALFFATEAGAHKLALVAWAVAGLVICQVFAGEWAWFFLFWCAVFAKLAGVEQGEAWFWLVGYSLIGYGLWVAGIL